MTRHTKKIFALVPVLCTLLLLGIGVSMPSLASAFLDYRLKQDVTQREDIQVSLDLTQSMDFFNTLMNFDIGQSHIEMTDGYRMTLTEAKTEAFRLIQQINRVFTEYGVEGWDGYHVEPSGDDDPADSYPAALPLLIANIQFPSQSGIFWECSWTWPDSDEQTTLWLDDQSGRLVAFYGSFRTNSSTSSHDYIKEYPSEKIAAATADFCESYYHVNSVQAVQRPVAEDPSQFDPLLYELDFTRKTGDDTLSFSIPLDLRYDRLYFNF